MGYMSRQSQRRYSTVLCHSNFSRNEAQKCWQDRKKNRPRGCLSLNRTQNCDEVWKFVNAAHCTNDEFATEYLMQSMGACKTIGKYCVCLLTHSWFIIIFQYKVAPLTWAICEVEKYICRCVCPVQFGMIIPYKTVTMHTKICPLEALQQPIK